MANAVVCTTPLIGVDFHRKTTAQEHRLGTLVNISSTVDPGYNGRIAIYVKAIGIIANSNYATVDMGSVGCGATSIDGGVLGTTSYRNGSVAFADGEYGWLMGNKRYPGGAA